MKVLNLSSGGTKFIGIVGCAYRVLHSGFRPDVITGVSAGAVACVPIAMGLWDKVIHKGLNVTLEDLFSVPPVDERNRIRFNTCLFTKGCFGISRLEELISEIIDRVTFQEYKVFEYPACYVQTVRIKNRAKFVWNLKELDYETFLKVVAASASIPIFTQGVWIQGQEHYDGGIRDSILSWWVMENLQPRQVVSIYSKSPSQGRHLEKDPDKPIKGIKHLLPTLTRTIECLVDEGFMNDAQLERELCKAKKVSLTQYMLPNILHGYYDLDKGRLARLYEESLNAKPVWQS